MLGDGCDFQVQIATDYFLAEVKGIGKSGGDAGDRELHFYADEFNFYADKFNFRVRTFNSRVGEFIFRVGEFIFRIDEFIFCVREDYAAAAEIVVGERDFGCGK